MKSENKYWKTRKAILYAIETGDERALKEFSQTDPTIFNQLVNQAKQSKFKIQRNSWCTK